MVNSSKNGVQLIRAEIDDEDLLCDLADAGLRADAYIPRGQMRAILKRSCSDVYIILYEEQVCGFAILYTGRTLHNLFIVDWARRKGVGGCVLSLLDPQKIRSKSDISTGNPREFYEAANYIRTGVDPEKPHIEIMEKQLNGNNSSVRENINIGIEEYRMLQESHMKVKKWREQGRARRRRRNESESQGAQGITMGEQSINQGNQD
jgi:hypothetical protein